MIYNIWTYSSESERVRLRMLNLISLISCIFTWLYSITLIFLGKYYPSSISFSVGVVYLIIIYMNRRRYRLVSKVVHTVNSNIGIYSFSCFLGHESGVHLYILLAPLFIFSLFAISEIKWIALCMGIYLLNYLAMMFLPHAVIFPKIGFLPQTVEFFYHLNILFTLTMITSVAAFVLTLNDKYILEILAKNESMTINQSKLQEEIRKRKESEEGLGKLFAELSLSYKNLEQISFMVSHNIRAPLTNILGYASLYEKSTDSAGANHLIVDGIEKSAKVLDEMLSDMNSILKSKNEVTGKRETLFFSDIVTDSANALKLDIEQNGIIVKHNFPKNQMITTSKSVIKSIVYNLLANAVKYRQQNGTAEIIISLNSNENDGVQTLTVEDNGIGMDLEKIEDKLFQLYSRFNNSGIEGKGIGLYLVKSHVESMGGTIKVQSRLNMGTKFIIILPNN